MQKRNTTTKEFPELRRRTKVHQQLIRWVLPRLLTYQIVTRIHPPAHSSSFYTSRELFSLRTTVRMTLAQHKETVGFGRKINKKRITNLLFWVSSLAMFFITFFSFMAFHDSKYFTRGRTPEDLSSICQAAIRSKSWTPKSRIFRLLSNTTLEFSLICWDKKFASAISLSSKNNSYCKRKS